MCAGPFMVESYERGSTVVLKANPHYWDMGADGKPLPYLEGVELRYVPRKQLPRSRLCATATMTSSRQSPSTRRSRSRRDSKLVVKSTPIFRLDYVYLNHQKPPLANKDFRLALNYAADREAILKAVYFGYGEVPNSYMPKVNFHSDTVPLIPFDPEKAKELVQNVRL